MATTLKAQAEAFLGATLDNTESTNFLNQAASVVLRRALITDPLAPQHLGALTSIGTGLSVVDAEFVGLVNRNGYPAVEIPPEYAGKAAVSTSLNYATTKFPVYYRVGGSIYVLPAPTEAQPAYCQLVKAPGNLTYTSESITGFSQRYTTAVILLTAIYGIVSLMSDVTYPSVISGNVAPTAPTLSVVTEVFPTFVSVPSFDLPTDLAAADVDFSGVSASPTFTAPSPILLPALSLSDGYTLPSTEIVAVPPVYGDAISVSDGTIGAFGTAPSFVAPVLDWASIPDIDVLVLPAPPPVDFTMSVSLSAIASVDGITLPVLGLPEAPTISEIDIDSITPPVPPESPDMTVVSGTVGAAPTYTGPTDVYSLATLITSINTSIGTDEDLAMAETRLAEMSSIISDFVGKTQSALHSFNAAKEQYIAELQTSIRNAELQHTVEATEYASKLQKFSAEVQLYSAQISSTVTQFASNEVQYRIGVWTTQVQSAVATFQAEVSALIEKYKADIANASSLTEREVAVYAQELNRIATENRLNVDLYASQANAAIAAWNAEQIQGSQSRWIEDRRASIEKYNSELQATLAEFNKQNVEYQANVAKAVKEAELQQSSDVAEIGAKLSKYAKEVDVYAQQVNSEAANITHSVNTSFQEWVEIRRNSLQEYDTNVTASLKKFEMELSEAVATYKAALELHTVQIEQALKTYAEETGYGVSSYSAIIQGRAIHAKTELESSVEDFQAGMAVYSKDLETVAESNQSSIALFQSSIQLFNTMSQDSINTLGANLQRAVGKINQYAALYSSLMQQYENCFVQVKSAPQNKEN